ncbi:MAG: YceI family protein [Kiritimatiellae bacterium]|nr:YceI family protein [Kiritimatiellia bacterium]
MMKQMTTMMALAVAGSLTTHAATYELDLAHSTIGFSVRHMMVTSVKGHAKEFQGVIEFDSENPTAMTATAEVSVPSIYTANEKRDDHLRGADFFDAETYPAITFVSTGVEGDLPDLTLHGDLTMKGITKKIAIPVEVLGPVVNPWGATVIGLEGQVTINRQDFGVSWSKALDGGGVVVGDEVKISIALEAVRKDN